MYCEKTSETEVALHASPEDMAFVLDLINSIEHPKATRLRKGLEAVVRSYDRFQLLIDRKIDICPKCEGVGSLMVGNLREYHNHDKEECYRCKGKGRKILVTTKRYEYIPDREEIG